MVENMEMNAKDLLDMGFVIGSVHISICNVVNVLKDIKNVKTYEKDLDKLITELEEAAERLASI